MLEIYLNPFATPTLAARTLATPTPLPLPTPSTNPTEPLIGIMQQYMMFKMAQSMGPFHPPSNSNLASPAFVPIAPTSQLPQLLALTLLLFRLLRIRPLLLPEIEPILFFQTSLIDPVVL